MIPKERLDMIRAMRSLLAQRFPLAFTRKGAQRRKRPLKLGIHRDVLAACPDLPVGDVMAAIRDFISAPSYLRECAKNVARIDLRGEPCGVVTAGHAAHAQRRLVEMERLRKSKARARRTKPPVRQGERSAA